MMLCLPYPLPCILFSSNTYVHLGWESSVGTEHGTSDQVTGLIPGGGVVGKFSLPKLTFCADSYLNFGTDFLIGNTVFV